MIQKIIIILVSLYTISFATYELKNTTRKSFLAAIIPVVLLWVLFLQYLA